MPITRVENLKDSAMRELGKEVANDLELDEPHKFDSQQWDRYGNAKADGESDEAIKEQFDAENVRKK